MSRLFADTPQSVEDDLIRRLDMMPRWYKLEMLDISLERAFTESET